MTVHLGLALLTLLPGRVGGSETYVRGLLDEFARGNGPERVTVLANEQVRRAYAGRMHGPVALHPVRAYRIGDSELARAAAVALALAAGPRMPGVPRDLDVVHYPLTVAVPAVRRPTVVTVLDVQHLERPEHFSRAELAYRRLAYDRGAHRASAVVVISEWVRERLIERTGIDPDRVAVGPLGIDLECFGPHPEPDDERWLAPLALPEDFVLYPANLWPHKNHERLLEGFARVAGSSAVDLVLTGQPYGRLERLLEHACRLGLEGRVHHLGHVPGDALAPLYRRARAVVFPSLYEGFGAPPLEAMACGCPVAASTAGSLPEVLGEAALAFDPGDPAAIAAALERVIGDEALRADLRRRGLERARVYTWESTARRHLAVYERVAGQTAARAPAPAPAPVPHVPPRPSSDPKAPAISVVVPSFNSGTYIGEALRSALDQEGPDLEVIVQDAGSIDDTEETVAALDDPRVRFVRERDAGQADALNRGIAKARGEWIVWLNADDLVAPGAFTAVAAALEREDLDVVFGDFHLADEHTRVVKRYESPPAIDRSRLLARGLYVFLGAMLMRRSAYERLGGYDPELHFCMDYEFALRIAPDVRAWHCGRELAWFRHQPDSKTSRQAWGFFREMATVRRRYGGFALRRLPSTVARQAADGVFMLSRPIWQSATWRRIEPSRRL